LATTYNDVQHTRRLVVRISVRLIGGNRLWIEDDKVGICAFLQPSEGKAIS